MKNLLLGLGMLLCIGARGQQVARGLTASNGQFIGFYEYKPTDYNADPTTKYPLIIFLHGIGERGNGTTELSRVRANGIPKYINAGHPMRFYWNGRWQTFLVLSPQLSSSYNWWQDFYIDEMIKYAKENLRVDTNRIILTGLSLGGGGVWEYATRSVQNASTFSAIGVCCPTCQFPNWCNIADGKLPTWAFHATNDGTTPSSCTNGAISAIINCGAAVKPYLTLWENGGHSVWDRAYDTAYAWQNPNIFEWFLGQDKSLPVNIRPKAFAGPDLTISTSTAMVTLSASGSQDEDGRLVRYVWRKIYGPSTGTINTPVSANGRTTITNLTTPGTYQFEVKAIDDRADYSLDTVTVTVVNGAAANIAPVAEAGPDRTVLLGITNLDASESYDPDGIVTNYTWTKIEGPDSYTLSSNTAVTPTLSNLQIGTYAFQLRTMDNMGAVSFDTVVVTSVGSSLPVTLQYFKGHAGSNGNRLEWATTTEYQNDRFEIERSEDGNQFVTIGTVKGSEQSSTLRTYTYIDEFPPAGVVYYRLRQVGMDRKATFLETITLSAITSGASRLSYYPNPVRDYLTIQLTGKENGTAKITLYSHDGRMLQQKVVTKQQHTLTTGMDTRTISKGIYLLEVIIDDRLKEVRKVVKQ